MEQKTTQRIIGFFILIALVIVALPLVFSKSETPLAEKTSLPEQSVNQAQPVQSAAVNGADAQPVAQLADTDTQNAAQAQPIATPPATEAAVPNSTTAQTAIPVTGQPSQNPDAAEPVITQEMASKINKDAESCVLVPPNVIGENTPSQPTTEPQQKIVTAENSMAKQQPLSQLQPQPQPQLQPQSEPVQVAANPVPAAEKPKLHSVKKAIKPIAKKTPAPSHANAKMAWAVQMGNFKNKQNVTRLVARLHAAGFKTFTRVVDNGQATKVYVGPESQQAAASALAKKVEQRVQMKGIVTSY